MSRARFIRIEILEAIYRNTKNNIVMKKNLCIVAMLLIAATSFAQNGQGKKQGDASKGQCPIEQMKKELKLTDAQVEKFQKLDADFKVEHQKMVEARKAEMQKKQVAMKEAKEKARAHHAEAQKDRLAQKEKQQKDRLKSIKGILTADQYVTFLENQFVKSQLADKGQFGKQGVKRFKGNKGFQEGKCGQGPEQMKKGGKQGCPGQCGAANDTPNECPDAMNEASNEGSDDAPEAIAFEMPGSSPEMPAGAPEMPEAASDAPAPAGE